MQNRLPLFLFLSALVLIGWSLLQRPGPESAPEEREVAGALPGGPPGADAVDAEEAPDERPIVGELVGESEERTLTVRHGTPGQAGSYLATFTNRGALLTELALGDSWDQVGLSAEEKLDPEHWVRLAEPTATPDGFPGSMALRTLASSKDLERTPLSEALWSMREVTAEEAGLPGVEFRLGPGSGVVLTKRVLFEPGVHRLHVQLGIENTGDLAPRTAEFVFTPVEVMPQASGDRFYIEPQAICAGRAKPKSRKDSQRPVVVESIPRDDKPTADELSDGFDVPDWETSFVGVQNKYFAMLMRAADAASQPTLDGASWRRMRDAEWLEENPTKPTEAWKLLTSDVYLGLAIPPAGEARTWDYIVYAGPKDRAELVADNPDHEGLIEKDLGFFDGIANLLLGVLGFFHGVTGNWGVAIILLTLSVRTLLFPMNRRSQTSMARYQKKMKRLQPRIDELKKKYDKDPQKMREAQTKLMHEEGLFPPLGGCLPIFVQIPVFFGLFSALRTSFDLRQAPFAGWIDDLSKPDRLLRLDLETHLPLIGTIEYLNVLPPLMVVLWVLQQRLMPKPADEQAARMQKMMMFMPIVMGFFLYNYAAGLSLYMITQSGLGIVEMGVIKKVWPIDDTEVVKKKGEGGFLSKLAEKHKEQVKRVEARQREMERQKAKSGKNRKKAKGRRR